MLEQDSLVKIIEDQTRRALCEVKNVIDCILAQYRHLHSHMGMIMGFIIVNTNQWPRILGLEKEISQGEYSKYFE